MRARTLAGLGVLLVLALGAGAGAPAALAGSRPAARSSAAPATAPRRAPARAAASPYGPPPGAARRRLTRTLRRDIRLLGRASGAYVLDLTTGRPLFGSAPLAARTPASVQKLYTTSVALLDFGPAATLTTQLFGAGTVSPAGVFTGTLYLRGGGDPTFGAAAFDSAYYGTGATVQALVASFVAAEHVTAVHGRVVGDAGYFDSLPSTIESGYAFDPFMEGSLSALAFDRGLLPSGAPVTQPGAYAARQLAGALRAAGIKLGRHLRYAAGATPAGTPLLASVASPPMGQLIALTNAPSDNFFAEMLAKGLGARFGAGGTTAAGVAVIRAQLASRFGLGPHFDDGSGLSRDDATSPRQVVRLLRAMAGNPEFVGSLAVAGETGTLAHEMNGTAAAGRCRGKTGTLSDVASLAGYCQAVDGHTLAFAFLANRQRSAARAHRIEAAMAVALARYNG